MKTPAKLLLAITLVVATLAAAAPAPGPLRIHPVNGRYFTDGTRGTNGSLSAIYLTGSHTWANLIDRGPSDPPPTFDFAGYLHFLVTNNHNFIRLWSRQLSWYRNYGSQPLHAAPLAWQRTGPGKALDGKAKFDLATFDPAYFQRLRSRVRHAGEQGIYVSIMLFGGLQEFDRDWTGNPFHRDNNINGVDGDPNKDDQGTECETLARIPTAVAEAQKAYVRKVVDTVNDLDNVLYEISNESGPTSQEWQYELIRFIRSYQQSKPQQHPVGMTMADWSPRENRARLDQSPADWVSYYFQVKPPASENGYSVSEPFATEGRKVSIQDSDHWWVVELYGNTRLGRDWVWKSFCRGHNPILMEHLPPRSFLAADHPLSLHDPGYMASRRAMGHTRRLAQRLNLSALHPRPDLASTRFCLAHPGAEYCVYQPNPGEPFRVQAQPGRYLYEWISTETGEAISVGQVVCSSEAQSFTAPQPEPGVLLLRAP